MVTKLKSVKTPIAKAINIEGTEVHSAFVEETSSISWQRKLAGFAVMTLACLGLGAMVGPVLDVLVISALIGTGSMFVATLVAIIGYAVSFYLGFTIGPIVYDAVTNGVIEDFAVRSFNKVRGWFVTEPVAA